MGWRAQLRALEISFVLTAFCFSGCGDSTSNPPGTDGLIKYTTISGDLDIGGTWKIQARVVFPTGEWKSSVDEFIVYPNIVF